ncbi:bifunctional 4-hydroxy-2-oxoglutarate aldolase/2-dehydro-3-deoxy-phosphogluconate aldolase [Persicobacter diffluens]|uniref:2-dehydro-3-deoxy-phosphogluconate aldolase n=1 Tax=Persicobacter diffluens TaxID=981 RepID=A0AAN4W4S5_9BACT|nr:2-dehydro-3-deoxy-phosphogluconate aldolase [Persicobacter diffluens]
MSKFHWEKFNACPVVGIVRNLDQATIDRLVPVYLAAGLSTLEVTMNTPSALELIADMSERYPEMNVGAGTVCTLEDLESALQAGAQFIVTPIMNEEVIATCVANQVPVFPGAYSPTEIYKAWTLGANAVKVFPATQLGTTFIKDILAPLNTIKLLPTGGVTADNITDFLKVGAVGVGMGSSLLPKDLMVEGKEAELRQHFDKIVAATKIALPQPV